MKLTNHHGLPDSLFNAIKKLNYDPRDAEPNRISITTLINNPRPRILALKHWEHLEEDAADHIWRVLGSGVHDILAKMEQANGNSLSEEKIVAEIDGWKVVGKLDLYSNGKVEDWKITSLWSVKFGKHDEWEKQLNPYAWLLRKLGFEVNELQINAILKDWRKSEGLKYSDYPAIPFKSIPVKLWTFAEQEAFVRERLHIYKEAMAMPLADLPYCSPEERWARPDVYAVYKGTNKTASRLLDTAVEADQWAKANLKPTDKYRIDKRRGDDLKCTEYCSVAPHCKYYQDMYMKPNNIPIPGAI